MQGPLADGSRVSITHRRKPCEIGEIEVGGLIGSTIVRPSEGPTGTLTRRRVSGSKPKS